MNQADFYEQKLTERLCLEISYADAIVLLGNLTLALRHPENVGMSADNARWIGAALAGQVYAHLEGKLPSQVLTDWQKAGFLTQGDLNQEE